MDAQTILRAIIGYAQNTNTIQRALSALRRSDISPTTLWRIYRQALDDDLEQYPPDVIVAMREYNRQMEAQQPYNRTISITIRCTENEKKIMTLLAQRHSMTLSEFIRDRCMREN